MPAGRQILAVSPKISAWVKLKSQLHIRLATAGRPVKPGWEVDGPHTAGRSGRMKIC